MLEEDKLIILAKHISQSPLEPDSVLLLIMKLEEIRDYNYAAFYTDTDYCKGQNKLLYDICSLVGGIDKVETLDRKTLDMLIRRIRSYFNVTQKHFINRSQDMYVKQFLKIIDLTSF